ncbi:MAG: VanZ family protein [Lachnospiraceae bacterium]|nr:VanZ family protein [Lachnospiraceae bacterium]
MMMWRRLYIKCGITIVTFLWMGIIFWFSAQPAVQSAGMSGGIVEKLQEMTANVPVIGQLFASEFAEHILRKGAHVAEYTVLGGLLFLCMRQYLPEKPESQERCGRAGDFRRVSSLTKNQALSAFSIGVLYAASDEFHQTFVPGRSGEIKDVCIDAIGVLVGMMLVKIAIRLWKMSGKVEKSRNACN